MSIHKVLKENWGYDEFRPLQEDIIRHILAGNDALALLPTGGGKSICFQVPALYNPGCCLVISPLIALMKDQVENLVRRGISARAIYSGQSRKDVINTLELSTRGLCRFLYVSPERLTTSLFREYLPFIPVNLLAIDEAHCISQWGHEFRPPYRRIAEIREIIPDVPVLALTASATPEVQQDICDQLQLKNYRIFQSSFARDNLSYSVFTVSSKINKVKEILQKVPGTGVIYCKSRKRTQDIARLLQMEGFSADFYHAGLSGEERTRKQDEWIHNKINTIVCTNAFGMGIDKPDVRIVIHYDIPDALEHYYQEAGRAGRDGKSSYAVLLMQEGDLEELKLQADIHYPSVEYIREVFSALVNYLQIPAYSGEGNYYNFDYTDFITKFRLNALHAIHALKAMEQDGLFQLSDQVFTPSMVGFTTNKNYLFEIQQQKPEWEPLITTLLRTYEGIFDQPVFIQEKRLAFLLQTEPDDIREQLRMLHRAAVLEYIPQKDSPQIYFLKDRPLTEDFTINKASLEERKKRFSDRVAAMIAFAKNAENCRSVIIGRYFGDNTIQPCGICDICRDKKKKELSSAGFADIHLKLTELLKRFHGNFSAVLAAMKPISEEDIWTVIRQLEAEQKIEVKPGGRIEVKE
ncbi:MAG TPA: ATP-dependent DNA helicase RecQ [Parasegetibacter sp.]